MGEKGFDAAQRNADVFLSDDATVQLGVGKNMVAAIRFWSAAFRVLQRSPRPGQPRVSIATPTPLGDALLDNGQGWDPYMEDPATLWVLHWHLVSSVTDVPVWWSTFNDFPAVEFDDGQLTEFVTDEVFATSWTQPNVSSISKDVDCLLRMYAPRQARARQTTDDMLDSPFRDLGIIALAPGSQGRYRFVRGDKPGLTSEVITYICLDHLSRTDPHARTVTVSYLTHDPGTPGRLLKLTEDAMLHALQASAERHPELLSIASPAGAPQLALAADAASTASRVLHSHYARRQPGLPSDGRLVAGEAARAIVSKAKPKSKRYPNAVLEAQAKRDAANKSRKRRKAVVR